MAPWKAFYTALFVANIALTPAPVYAGWLDSVLGYDSYEACILDKMEGVTSDVAAVEIRRACRKLTNSQGDSCSQTLTGAQRDGITGQGRTFDSSFIVDVYNPQRNIKVTGMEVRVIGYTKNGNFERNINIKGSIVSPLSSGTLTGNLGISPEKITSWIIVAVYGCQV